jgi:hypothetical protein
LKKAEPAKFITIKGDDPNFNDKLVPLKDLPVNGNSPRPKRRVSETSDNCKCNIM